MFRNSVPTLPKACGHAVKKRVVTQLKTSGVSFHFARVNVERATHNILFCFILITSSKVLASCLEYAFAQTSSVVHLINLAHTASIMEPPSPTAIAALDAGFGLIIRAVEALDVARDPAQVRAEIDLPALALVSKDDHMDTATARDKMSCMDPFVAMQLHNDELKCTFNTPAVSGGVYVYEVRHVEEVCPPPILQSLFESASQHRVFQFLPLPELHSNLAFPKRAGTLAPVAFSRLERDAPP
jgi:hypothetical protein